MRDRRRIGHRLQRQPRARCLRHRGRHHEDDNGNGTPDACEIALGDLNLDGCIDSGDLGLLIALWGIQNPPFGDLNGDGVIAAADLGLLIGNWTPCP